MDLKNLYCQVKEAISVLDLEKVWPGLVPLKFALYDNKHCFFDGEYIKKTADFCANTSIRFNGEQIAIWMVAEESDVSVLASKLIHEMFHGYQATHGWDCLPNEMDALFHYRYSAENLSLKLRENELLLELLDHFDPAAYRELLMSRKMRSEKYPYEFLYESKIEETEGTANFVEWKALEQLDQGKALTLMDRMRLVMTRPEHLFPIRISGYYTGALMINAMLHAGNYSFDPAVRPVILSLLKDIDAAEYRSSGSESVIAAVTEALSRFDQGSEEIIRSALDRNEIVLKGPFELVGVNIYDARRCGEYITSTYFLMYRDEEDKLLEGDFVIRIKDERTIDTVYRLK